MTSLVNDIAVLVPAHQAEATLEACLAAILAEGVTPAQLFVVDDGSRDATARIARATGAHVLQHDTPLRPARARNAGMSRIAAMPGGGAEIVVFVDADVILNAGALPRLLAPLADPEVAATIGSYDQTPTVRRTVSRYRNLLHHHVHQTARREAEIFWSGLGAVRRAAFEEVGGLDPAWENIEDVEFGLRLRESGRRIELVPEAQATHAKDWTLRGMFRTDLWGRAVPWTRLLIAGRMPPSAMNGALAHRLAAAGVGLAGSSLLVAPFWPPALLPGLIGAALFLGANLPLWRRLARIGGIGFAVASVPAHAVHYVAALLGYVYAHLRPHPETPPAARTGTSPPRQAS